MAIVINGDMPKNCDECNIKWCCPIRFEAREDKTSRHPSCPIIGEIPDKHGDLVDRAKALYELRTLMCDDCRHHKGDDCSWCSFNECLEAVEDAPVILEASK